MTKETKDNSKQKDINLVEKEVKETAEIKKETQSNKPPAVKRKRSKKVKVPLNERYLATGRRKEAIATVQLFLGAGRIKINKRPLNEYFQRHAYTVSVRQPLKVTESSNKFDINITVKGGGLSGQAGAIRHALSRALVKYDSSLKKVLRQGGFLTRDPRMKERKKYGQKGARKRFQFSKR